MRILDTGRIQRVRHYLSDPSFWPIMRFLATNAWMRLVGKGTAHNNIALFKNCRGCEPFIRQLPFETQQTDGIPKIIFQTWKSRIEIPSNYRYWRNTFLKHNPDFQYLLWDDADNRAFITDQFAWFLPLYERFPTEIFRVDAIRPFFLLRYGGIYVDMDTECLKPLATMPISGDIVLGQMGPNLASEHSIPNAIMASKPFQLFWALFIAMMIEKADEFGSAESLRQRGPEACTGPLLLKEAFEFYHSEPEVHVRARAQPVTRQLSEALRARLHAGKIEVLARDLWYPMDWNNRLHRRLRSELLKQHVVLNPAEARALFPNASLVTYWTHSW